LNAEQELEAIFIPYCRLSSFYIIIDDDKDHKLAMREAHFSEEARQAFSSKMTDYLKSAQKQVKDLGMFMAQEIVQNQPSDSLGSVMMALLKASVPTFAKQAITLSPFLHQQAALSSVAEKAGKEEEKEKEAAEACHELHLFFQGILACLEVHLSSVTSLFLKMQRLERHRHQRLSHYKQ
jgi:hypothetical protein